MTPFTPITDSSGLVLTSPDTVLSAIPYLLGFAPSDSIVIVWLQGRHILLTQRADLPTAAAEEDAWVDLLFSHAAVKMCESVIVVAYCADPAAAEVVAQIRARAAIEDLRVVDALRTHGDRWWSLLCKDDDCCDQAGRPIDASDRAAIGAEFAIRGVAPSGTREEIAAELTADPVGRVAVIALLAERAAERAAVMADDRDGAAREARRDALIEAGRRALQGQTSDARHSAADLIEGLADIRVRDTLMWECSGLWKDELRVARATLAHAVTVAPPGKVAPVATMAAIMAWLLGDGVRASVALERAWIDDPDYSLGQLIAAAVQGGLPPDGWRASIQQLTREECRHGFQPEPPKRRKKRAKKRK